MASRFLLSLLFAPALAGCGMAAGRFRHPGGKVGTIYWAMIELGCSFEG